MTEDEFWPRLEFRLCREFSGLAGKEFEELRHFSCDGFIPEAFEIGSDGACITGRVWIGVGGRNQEEWRFCLFPGEEVSFREDVRWAELLPAEDMTGWLSCDKDARQLRILPCSAHPNRDSR